MLILYDTRVHYYYYHYYYMMGTQIIIIKTLGDFNGCPVANLAYTLARRLEVFAGWHNILYTVHCSHPGDLAKYRNSLQYYFPVVR